MTRIRRSGHAYGSSSRNVDLFPVIPASHTLDTLCVSIYPLQEAYPANFNSAH